MKLRLTKLDMALIHALYPSFPRARYNAPWFDLEDREGVWLRDNLPIHSPELNALQAKLLAAWPRLEIHENTPQVTPLSDTDIKARWNG